METPFEGQGSYEGRYREGHSPEGWRESGMAERESTAAEQARQQQQQQEQARQEQARLDQQRQEQARREAGTTDGRGAPALGTDGGRAAEGAPPPTVGAPPPTAGAPPAPGAPGTEGALGRRPEAPTPPAAANVGPVIRQLQGEAQAIRGSTDLRHADVIAALRDLASVLAAMPSGDAVRANVDQINALADQLAASDPQSLLHADWTKAALQQGVEALTTVAGAAGMAERVEPQLREARAQIDGIRDGVGLLKQTDAVADALGGMANTLLTVNQRAQPPAGTQ